MHPGPRAAPGEIDGELGRRCTAELIGTAFLVFFGCGVATVSFGFRAFGSSVAAGILITGLTFGLVLLALVAVIGPVSGCHVNPAVTLGAYLSKRIDITDATGYWVAQIVGGIIGALLLLWVMHSSPFYIKSRIGLGANGWGRLSLLHASGGGAFLTEVIITAVFVLVVLSATRKEASAALAGVVVGLTLALVNVMAIPVDGASANPARSFGPAIIVGGLALSQIWLFLIAPLVGGVLAAGVYLLMHPMTEPVEAGDARAESAMTESAMTLSAADEDERRRAAAAPDTAPMPDTAHVRSGETTPPDGSPADRQA